MKIIAKTLYGLEEVVAEEMRSLGAQHVAIANRAVIFEGELPFLYAVNYMSRTALSFLAEIAGFRINSADDLYRKILKISWDAYLDTHNTFSVVPVVKSKIFNHTGFAALKAKDAIADFFRNRTGKRPSVSASDPDVVINLHISHETVTVSLDSTVIPLYKRGYRTESVSAPLNEVLAAGLLSLAKWKPEYGLTDPMCGSGTIGIEAGLIATGVPPGRFRKSFGFQRWPGYDDQLFELVREKYDKAVDSTAPVNICCSDNSALAVRKAASNLKAAGLQDIVQLSCVDFREMKPQAPGRGFMIMNPPYGERMSQGETNELYEAIGTALKHNFEGYTAWIISSNRESLKHIGLKPSEKHVVFNGSLECFYERFDMYQGSRKRTT
ncbi:MAG TPA: class I SAM-dependent RNA methyltransferase [Bacteroidales bacterium]|nr:class I SAM-dependent RNA methyltransferase [Bacteroidales bacterium]